MKAFIPAVAAATLALAASFAFAQGAPGYGPGMGGQGMGPGGAFGRADPARHEQMRAAYEACKDKADHRACMTEQFCAKSADPARCQTQARERQARAAQRLEQRQVMHEACNGKRGEELTNCFRNQQLASRNQRLDERQKAHEACAGKRGEDLAKCLGAQGGRPGFGRPGPKG